MLNKQEVQLSEDQSSLGHGPHKYYLHDMEGY